MLIRVGSTIQPVQDEELPWLQHGIIGSYIRDWMTEQVSMSMEK